MQLFPERPEPRDRRLLPIALILSFFAHVALVGTWVLFGLHVAPAIDRLLPRPSPTPEIVALSDAITIEKRSVPRPAHRSPQRQAQRAQRPRQVARIPVPPAPQVPTIEPLPTTAPTREPTYRPEPGTIHHPRPAPSLEPRPVPAVPPAAEKGAFSQQQMAALNAQFSKTIAQAQHSLSEVPPQRRPPARNPEQINYKAVMAGTPEQFLSAQGECDSIQSSTHGAVVYRYLRCRIYYSDGYFEEVSFPWAYVFSRRNDPFDDLGTVRRFPMQAPPQAFALPRPFALSRAVCSFYRAECQDVITREKANGNQPATSAQ